MAKIEMMDAKTIRSILQGVDNIRHRKCNNYLVLEEAAEVLENKEELLEEYDCYDYLFQ